MTPPPISNSSSSASHLPQRSPPLPLPLFHLASLFCGARLLSAARLCVCVCVCLCVFELVFLFAPSPPLAGNRSASGLSDHSSASVLNAAAFSCFKFSHSLYVQFYSFNRWPNPRLQQSRSTHPLPTTTTTLTPLFLFPAAEERLLKRALV